MTTPPSDPHNLQRFLDAQSPVYSQVLAELREGRKRSHWMWFIFPQIAGLGSSPTAEHFAISGRAEALAYLAHPILGPRLRECAALVNQIPNRTITDIFAYPDDLKFRSSITLFAAAAPAEPPSRCAPDNISPANPTPPPLPCCKVARVTPAASWSKSPPAAPAAPAAAWRHTCAGRPAATAWSHPSHPRGKSRSQCSRSRPSPGR